MDPIIIGIAGILLMILLVLLRMNIGFAMGVVGFAGFVLLTSFSAGISMLGMVTYKSGSSYALTVVPLFILMGLFFNTSRIGSDLYQTAYRLIGFLPGGLAMTTIVACAGLAAISGSSLATAAIIGIVALPEMKRFNYDDALALGSIAAGSTLAVLIPPSTIIIVYGILAEQPIGMLIIAGIMPGILLTLLFMATIYLLIRHKKFVGPAGQRFSRKEKLLALMNTGGPILLVALIIVGLYTGLFSPTEAAAVGAFGALVIVLFKGGLTKDNFIGSLREAAMTTAMIFTLIIGANILGYFMTVSHIPDGLSRWIVSVGISKYVVILVICIIYILLGSLMEGMAIMVLTLPVIFPIVLQMGFDPVWFGVISVLFIEMSLITPPAGLNILVVSGITKDIPKYVISRSIVPFLFTMVIFAIMLIFFPQIVLFLPQTMGP
jgi:tripartite ATP-independent transporter DctM subunit